jgi:fructose-1,6-bisphosphatase/sedoheptulose 1,7-bisphosphatase-like protein
MGRNKLYTEDTVRIYIQIDIPLAETIKEMAKKKNWSESYMSYVLLQQAVKEKNRKKSATKEVHS